MRHKLIAPLFFILAALFAAPASAQLACPDPFSARGLCTPITVSTTGTTGATSVTIPAVAGKTAYLCAFNFTGSNATGATNGSVTITGLVGGTVTYGYPTLVAGAAVPNTPPIDEGYTPCIPATAANVAIVVNGPALGTGAPLVTLTASGYYL